MTGKRIVLLAAMMLALPLASCSVLQPPQEGRVTHVVIIWLKNSGDEHDRQKIIEATNQFKTIPGVMSITTGRPVPSTRPVVESSYDVGLVIQFSSESALHKYEKNPRHQRVRESILKPLAARWVVYDVKQEK